MNYRLITFIAIGMILFSLPAWSASTKDEVLKLQSQVEQMQKDLDEIKKLLQQGARAPGRAAQPSGFKPQTVDVGASPYKGDVDAPVTLVEYSDYQCPFCARNYRQVLPSIEKEFIETGKVKFVMRENPLPNLHRDAMNASIAALCAGDQDSYWEMHNVMFENPKQLSVENLKAYASEMGLNTTEFNKCLDDKKYEKQIADDLASGAKLGLRGTPAFVLGLTDKDDPNKVNLTVYIKGAQGFDKFKSEIEALLKSAE